MSTVKKIIELLSTYPQDFELLDEQNRPFIHIINTDDNTIRLSTRSPIGICKRSGGYVYPSVVEGYEGFSPDLDEDLYGCEFIRDMSNLDKKYIQMGCNRFEIKYLLNYSI
jgi:hypothetical protein